MKWPDWLSEPEQREMFLLYLALLAVLPLVHAALLTLARNYGWHWPLR